jgi:hypothetical protein
MEYRCPAERNDVKGFLQDVEIGLYFDPYWNPEMLEFEIPDHPMCQCVILDEDDNLIH